MKNARTDFNSPGINDLLQFPDNYQKIIHNIHFQLEKFAEEKQNSHSKVDNSKLLNMMSYTQEKIGSTLHSSEIQTIERYKECETVNHWLSLLQTQQNAFEKAEDHEDGSLGTFILSFKNNANQLRSLETDLTSFLRILVDKTETPLSTRLSQIHIQAKNEIELRQEVLNQLKKNTTEIDRKLDFAQKEGTQLQTEMEIAQKQLESFSSSKSYEIVQKAKKSHIIGEEWKKKKESLMEQINQASSDVESFRLQEKNSSIFLKTISENDDQLYKMKNKYEDGMRIIKEEMSISQTTHNTMIAALQKDLEKARNSLLTSEKAKTTNDLKKLKSSNERMLTRIKKNHSNSLKNLEKSMKKVSDSGNIDALISMIQEDFNESSTSTKKIIDEQINELNEIFKRNIDNLYSVVDQKISGLEKSHQNQVIILETKRTRIKQRLNERDLELGSISSHLASMEGLILDYINEFEYAQNNHDLLQSNLQKHNNDQSARAGFLKESVSSAQRFIERATQITLHIHSTLEKKISKKNDFQIPKLPKRAASELIKIDYYSIKRKELAKINNDLFAQIWKKKKKKIKRSSTTANSISELKQDLSKSSENMLQKHGTSAKGDALGGSIIADDFFANRARRRRQHDSKNGPQIQRVESTKSMPGDIISLISNETSEVLPNIIESDNEDSMLIGDLQDSHQNSTVDNIDSVFGNEVEEIDEESNEDIIELNNDSQNTVKSHKSKRSKLNVKSSKRAFSSRKTSVIEHDINGNTKSNRSSSYEKQTTNEESLKRFSRVNTNHNDEILKDDSKKPNVINSKSEKSTTKTKKSSQTEMNSINPTQPSNENLIRPPRNKQIGSKKEIDSDSQNINEYQKSSDHNSKEKKVHIIKDSLRKNTIPRVFGDNSNENHHTDEIHQSVVSISDNKETHGMNGNKTHEQYEFNGDNKSIVRYDQGADGFLYDSDDKFVENNGINNDNIDNMAIIPHIGESRITENLNKVIRSEIRQNTKKDGQSLTEVKEYQEIIEYMPMTNNTTLNDGTETKFSPKSGFVGGSLFSKTYYSESDDISAKAKEIENADQIPTIIGINRKRVDIINPDTSIEPTADQEEDYYSYYEEEESIGIGDSIQFEDSNNARSSQVMNTNSAVFKETYDIHNNQDQRGEYLLKRSLRSIQIRRLNSPRDVEIDTIRRRRERKIKNLVQAQLGISHGSEKLSCLTVTSCRSSTKTIKNDTGTYKSSSKTPTQSIRVEVVEKEKNRPKTTSNPEFRSIKREQNLLQVLPITLLSVRKWNGSRNNRK